MMEVTLFGEHLIISSDNFIQQNNFHIYIHTLDLDDLDDLFRREDEGDLLSCSKDNFSVVVSPSESDGKSFSSSSELSLTKLDYTGKFS